MHIRVVEEKLTDGSVVFDVRVQQNGQAFRWHCPDQQSADAFRAALAALVSGLTIDDIDED